jgi:hypothetical protein
MTLRSVAKTLVWTSLLLIGGLTTEAVAIVVAPTAIYLTADDRAAVIQLYNPSTQPEEVSVEAIFGYPATDEEGRIGLHMTEEKDPRSAADWIQVLPRRLVVPPGERRAVRLLAQPPLELRDGEYWTRLIFTSRGQSVPVTGTDTAAVKIGLGLEVRTVIALTYRKGAVDTGLRVRDFEPRIEGDSLLMRPEFLRAGEGAYIGRMELTLIDTAGIPVRSWEEQLAVYRDYRRHYAYDVEDVPRGEYRLLLHVDTDREDVPEADRLPADPVELSVYLTRS